MDVFSCLRIKKRESKASDNPRKPVNKQQISPELKTSLNNETEMSEGKCENCVNKANGNAKFSINDSLKNKAIIPNLCQKCQAEEDRSTAGDNFSQKTGYSKATYESKTGKAYEDETASFQK